MSEQPLTTKRSHDTVVDDWRRLLFTKNFGCSNASNDPRDSVEDDAKRHKSANVSQIVAAESSRTRKPKTSPLWNNLQGIPTELITDPPLINILKLIENSNLLRMCGHDDRHDNRRGSKVIYQNVHDVIHTQTYTYESNLLTEIVEIRAKNGAVVRTRPCVFGQHCQGLSSAIRGFEEHGGAILREYLSPKEYESFNSAGKHPEERRPCLLCLRSQIHFAYMCLLQSTNRFPNPSILINSFVNPRNSVDGYMSEYMIPREDSPRFQGIAGSVCVAEKHLLHWRRDSANATSLGTTSRDTTDLIEDVVCALRAYFRLRAANVESLLSADSTDRRTTQIKLAQFVQDSRHELPIRIVHMLHLLLDHHIVSEIHERGKTKDAKDDNPVKKTDCVQHHASHIVSEIPEARIVTSETLADIDRCVHKAVFLMSSNVAIRTTTPNGEFRSVHAMMCHVISKCVPRACHMRSLTTVLDRYTHDSREMRDILVDIVMCGALGNFLDSKERACLTIRRLLYESRDIVSRIVENRLAEKTDDMFIFFSIREHVVTSAKMSDAISNLIRTFLPQWLVGDSHHCVSLLRPRRRVFTYLTFRYHATYP
ncbi:hypothetical protein CYMTET_15524 [Cymbomonas tetramitiformis]|uniref:Uncharacterized protein n=1 Tax=Cymbomonas tetramitiformis TaxID=36881 RepID=A0AAE0GE71_9CHLO|nr:hypothetical protein CYMTET_15524 [Cymbomonas tetramitiformis]